MNRISSKRAMLAREFLAVLTVASFFSAGCDRAPGPGTKVVTGQQQELEPRPVLPAPEDVASIRIQADEGFLGGPLDETIAAGPLTTEVLKVLHVIRAGPRTIGDVGKYPKKGQLTIKTKSGLPLELRLSDDRAIHFISAFEVDMAAIEEIIKKLRAEKK